MIAFVSWLIPARLVRGETLTLRVREYVQAVKVMGGSRSRIVLRHIIPNTVGTIIVNATFQVADAILLLAALGFLGLGVQPPQTDWGSMLSNGVQLRPERVLVGDLPGGSRHRARGGGLQLRRRRPTGRSRGPTTATLIVDCGLEDPAAVGTSSSSGADPVAVWSGKWQAAR